MKELFTTIFAMTCLAFIPLMVYTHHMRESAITELLEKSKAKQAIQCEAYNLWLDMTWSEHKEVREYAGRVVKTMLKGTHPEELAERCSKK